MDLGDITGKAEAFLNDPKVKDALKSEQAEGISDNILEGVADVVEKATGGKFDEQIEAAKKAADGAIGNQ
jgi:hypothetical protein